MLLPNVGASLIRLTLLDLHTLAKCPIFLQLFHCALRAGHMCSSDEFCFPQKRQFPFENFFLSGRIGFGYRVRLVYLICSSSDELFVESFLGFLYFGFLSPYLWLWLSCSMVSSTISIFSGLFMNLSQAFLSLMVASNL